MLDIFEFMSNIDVLYKKMTEEIRIKYQLTQTEFDVLMFLYNNPEYDKACDIVNKRNISKSHVSTSVKSLTERGLLEGKYEKENRKNIHLVVCEKAYEIVEEGRKNQIKFYNRIHEGFSKTDFESLEYCLAKINQNAREAIKWTPSNKKN